MRKYPQCSGCFVSSLSSTFSLTEIKSPRFPLFLLTHQFFSILKGWPPLLTLRSSSRLVFYYSYLYPSPPEIESSPVISHCLIIVPKGSLIPFSYSISYLSTTSKIFHCALWNSGSVIRIIYYISTTSLNYLAFLLYLKLDSAEVPICSTLPFYHWTWR